MGQEHGKYAIRKEEPVVEEGFLTSVKTIENEQSAKETKDTLETKKELNGNCVENALQNCETEKLEDQASSNDNPPINAVQQAATTENCHHNGDKILEENLLESDETKDRSGIQTNLKKKKSWLKRLSFTKKLKPKINLLSKRDRVEDVPSAVENNEGTEVDSDIKPQSTNVDSSELSKESCTLEIKGNKTALVIEDKGDVSGMPAIVEKNDSTNVPDSSIKGNKMSITTDDRVEISDTIEGKDITNGPSALEENSTLICSAIPVETEASENSENKTEVQQKISTSSEKPDSINNDIVAPSNSDSEVVGQMPVQNDKEDASSEASEIKPEDKSLIEDIPKLEAENHENLQASIEETNFDSLPEAQCDEVTEINNEVSESVQPTDNIITHPDRKDSSLDDNIVNNEEVCKSTLIEEANVVLSDDITTSPNEEVENASNEHVLLPSTVEQTAVTEENASQEQGVEPGDSHRQSTVEHEASELVEKIFAEVEQQSNSTDLKNDSCPKEDGDTPVEANLKALSDKQEDKPSETEFQE